MKSTTAGNVRYLQHASPIDELTILRSTLRLAATKTDIITPTFIFNKTNGKLFD